MEVTLGGDVNCDCQFQVRFPAQCFPTIVLSESPGNLKRGLGGGGRSLYARAPLQANCIGAFKNLLKI